MWAGGGLGLACQGPRPAACASLSQRTISPAPCALAPLRAPGEKVPATFVGHSMSITFDMGSCTFNDSKWIHDDEKVGAGKGGGAGRGGIAVPPLGRARRPPHAVCPHPSRACPRQLVTRPAPPRRPPQQLECVEPSISYVKSPANFTSKYHSAPRWGRGESRAACQRARDSANLPGRAWPLLSCPPFPPCP